MAIPKNALLMYFPADHVNGMLNAFDLLIQTIPGNETALAAANLKKKIIAHGRVFRFQDSDAVSVMFFESELRSLIQILSLFAFAVQDNCRDYLPEIVREKKARAGQ